jgi:hypothetical protein
LCTRFPTCAIALPHYLKAHGTGGALDHPDRRLDRRAIEIGKFFLGDLLYLRFRDLAGKTAAGGFRADAFFKKNETGGNFISNVKERSWKAVMTTGIGVPFSICAVLALKALQNSMMFKPRCPSAGPIGGEGLAAPAGT